MVGPKTHFHEYIFGSMINKRKTMNPRTPQAANYVENHSALCPLRYALDLTFTFAALLISGCSPSDHSSNSQSGLAFRGFLQGYPNTDNEVFWNTQYWDDLLKDRSNEGFTAVVWYGPNEFTNGQHMLVRHIEFPEARELTEAENDRIISHWQWIFDRAHEYGLGNYLLTQHIFTTKAFAQSHGLLEPGPTSPTVSQWQKKDQWQIPLESFMRDVRPGADANDLWLGFHGYNSEQITDAKPYPGAVRWSETTGLPTVPDIYPANQLFFPFNSPKFAHEIVSEMLRVTNFAGFLYYERHISGSIMGPLFRKALARYGRSFEAYSPEPWVTILAEQTGNRESAQRLLNAYDACARVIPETCALVYSGGDVMRRELRIPYEFFSEPFPWSHMTSPARGGRLVPVRHYSEMIARDRERLSDNGSDHQNPPYYQHPVWGSEGGSVYNVTPVRHMQNIRELGALCLSEAESALEIAQQGHEALTEIRDIMEGVHLLSIYYEKKVAAAIAALVFKYSGLRADRRTAEQAADKALEAYVVAAEFMHERLDPFYERVSGSPLHEAGIRLPELIAAERRDREMIGRIFGWNESQ